MAKIEHVGIIPDGNRRWAVKNNLDYTRAYQHSARHLTRLIDWIFNWQIRHLSVYTMSRENLNRDKEEVGAMVEAGAYLLSQLLYPVCEKHRCRVIHAGDKEILPEKIGNTMEELCLKTIGYNDRHLYLLLGYHPMDELNQAVARHPGRPLDITDLTVPAKVDLVIRTAGGNCPMSNFLPIQCGYAQFFILDEYFNEMTRDRVANILARASGTKMRYGR